MFEKQIAEVLEHGGKMPSTTLKGFIYEWENNVDLTEEQNETAHDWMIAEINRLLPDYATWYESTSEIVLPIDKVDGFDVDWQELLEEAYEHYLDRENPTADCRGGEA